MTTCAACDVVPAVDRQPHAAAGLPRDLAHRRAEPDVRETARRAPPRSPGCPRRPSSRSSPRTTSPRRPRARSRTAGRRASRASSPAARARRPAPPGRRRAARRRPPPSRRRPPPRRGRPPRPRRLRASSAARRAARGRRTGSPCRRASARSGRTALDLPWPSKTNSAPRSTSPSANGTLWTRPPTRSRASRTTTSRPAAASASAAASPANPAPMTAIPRMPAEPTGRARVPSPAMRAAVLTISTSLARGEGEDRSGPRLAELLAAAGCEVLPVEVLPDDADGDHRAPARRSSPTTCASPSRPAAPG